MKIKPVRLRSETGQFIKQTESRLNSAAFLIARAIKRNGNVWQGRRVYVPEAAYNAMGIRFDHYARRRGVANVHGPNGYYSGNRKHQDALKQSYYDLERGEWVLPELAQELGIEAQLIKWMTR